MTDMEGNFSHYRKNGIAFGGALGVAILSTGIFLAVSAAYFYVRGQWRDVALAAFFLVLLPCLYPAERLLKIRFTPLFLGMGAFLLVGSFLGCGYNLYTVFPASDKILHGVSGALFASLGCALAGSLLGAEGEKRFYFRLVFGVMFTLSVALLWELFERLSDGLLPVDMQEDTLIRNFSSYFLSGTHERIEQIEDITQTVIYYGDGKSIVLDGYLDVGLSDTIGDMAACLLGGAVWFFALVVDRKRSGRLYRALVPVAGAEPALP